ncbi:MAG: PIN domain-containing protein [Bacteroidota bacterium]
MAKQILEAAIQGQISLYTSSSIVTILGYWLTKAYGAVKAKELLIALLDDVQILETGHETAIEALLSKFTDIEDALQYHTAIYHKLDVFISRDSHVAELGRSSFAGLFAGGVSKGSLAWTSDTSGFVRKTCTRCHVALRFFTRTSQRRQTL